MGLTIHYSLKALGSDAQARKLVHALHQAAQDLPFKDLGQVVELSGKQCDFNKRTPDDPLRWLLIQASKYIEPPAIENEQRGGFSNSVRVLPTRVICFGAWPGEGCEHSNFGLCRYPAKVETDRGPMQTGFAGWRWRSFVKTQYSSDPNCGGVPNFLRCHLAVIAMLDKAKQLGCLEEVHDEGHFWEKRDLHALVEQIGSWNQMIAAFGGLIKDLAGESSMSLEMPISQFPDFERLEAAGQDKLPAGLASLIKLIRRTGREGPAT